jgi:hypothetical protein
MKLERELAFAKAAESAARTAGPENVQRADAAAAVKYI